MKRYVTTAIAVCAAAAAVSAQAQSLLLQGGFELLPGIPEVEGWELEEFATGTNAPLNTASLAGFAACCPTDQSDLGLWLRAFAGGREVSANNLTNAILSQTVPGTADETYTFTGWSRWEGNYSGGVVPPDVLATGETAGPLAGQESPTRTEMELAFLDSGGNVLGTPVVLDLRTEQDIFGDWVQHTLVGQAPANTASVRVTAAGRDMVYNTEPQQSAFYDSFSLTGDGAPASELLTNGGLEIPSPSGLDSWTVVNDDPGNPDNEQVIRLAGFASRTGSNGVWLSSFFGESGTEVSGSVSQTVPGEAGGEYSLTGWSLFQPNYSGGLSDTITETFIELAFLDESDAVIGDPVTLDVGEEQTNGGGWQQHALDATSPEGTASVRVTAGMLNGFTTEMGQQSAFFDDFFLRLGGLVADFDKDGDVDGDDFLAWQAGFGTETGATQADGDADGDGDVDGDDFLLWQANFQIISGTGSGSAAVPEPAGLLLAAVLAGLAAIRRRRG